MSDYRALYRKWRPVDFDDVSGQNAITDILKYEVDSNKLSHAYLFCGSRGTGKTSCAKILAKAVNCLDPRGGNPCNKCEACRSIDSGVATDVIEMDAASNNGVDNVRDMKDEIAFTPALLKYRVYIIDEVHMMSSSAFNALLKTLEEPPSYVIFILATTEYHKLPTTIVSRCQRFDFKRIANSDIVSRLSHISEKEGIDLTEEGARVIARIARGGMRDAVSLLELCAGTGARIDADLVFETVGSGNRDSTYKLIESILDGNYSGVYSTVAEVVRSSGDISVFWQEIIDSYRDIMVVKNTDKAKDYLDLTDNEAAILASLASRFSPARLAYHVSLLEGAMADMLRAFNSKRSIAEIALTRMCDARTAVSLEALALRVEELERELSMVKMGVDSPGRIVNDSENVRVLPSVKEDAPAPVSASPKESGSQAASAPKTVKYDRWQSVIERIGELKQSLSVQFIKSVAYRRPDGSFLIRMNSFFASRLASSDRDLSILRGVLAEVESCPVEQISINIEPLDPKGSGDLMEELVNAIDN